MLFRSLELWLSTDYKLTEQEMEDAQSMLDEYFAPGTAAQQLRDANSAGMAGVMRNKMTDKESQKYQLMAALSNKTSTWNSLVIGALNAIPLLNKCVDWSNDILGEAEGRTILDVSEMERMYANSSVQHPIASGGGGILGSLALYNAAVKVANSIPQIAKLAGSWAGSLSKLPILGKINKKHLSNILGATIVDAGVYTLPQTVKDIVDKKSVGTILGNILLDSGKNLGLNIAGEGAGVLLGKVSKVASDGIKRGKKTADIKNPILDNIRSGSALKDDSLHAFNDIIDNYAGDATRFSLMGGDGVKRSLYQIEGSLNGKKGIFEWIVDPDPTKGITHRRFIEGVDITGKPNARP